MLAEARGTCYHAGARTMNRTLAALTAERFDVLVIGGGIFAPASPATLALRGMRVR